MASVTLGDALKLAKEAEVKAGKLYSRIREVSTATYNQGESLEEPEISVDELFNQIKILNEKSRMLRQLVAKTNVETMSSFQLDGRYITQGEAILLLSQLLSSKGTWEMLANNRPKVRQDNPYRSNGVTQWTEVTYDIEEAKVGLSILEKNIRELRTAIDRVNINTMLKISDEYANF